MSLLFGSKYKAKDYLYEDEINGWLKDGILDNAFEAFSRDQAHKVYVQHRMAEHLDLINDYLYTRKGFFFLCGIGGPLEVSVRQEVKNAFMKCNNWDEKQADEYIEQFTKEGRYNFETW